MEKQPRLTSISVSYQNSPIEEFNDLRKRKDFTDSLSINPLSSIDHMNVSYELNLKIEHGNSPHKWAAFKDGILFFSFICNNEKDFIDIFEKKLKEKFCEINNSPEHEADIMY